MLIDDDLISREVTATVLTLAGYRVETAESGEQALRSLAAGLAADVLLIDAQMPGLSGVPLLEALRVQSPARLCLISASRPGESLLDAADGFLQKPFTAGELRVRLDELARARAVESGRRTVPAATPQAARKTMAAELSVVRPDTLAQLRSMMPAASVRQIYAAVADDLGARLVALEAALGEGNLSEVGRIGHAIKGGSGMAGAAQVAAIGARLEQFADGDSLDDCRVLLDDLRRAAGALARMLEAEFPVIE